MVIRREKIKTLDLKISPALRIALGIAVIVCPLFVVFHEQLKVGFYPKVMKAVEGNVDLFLNALYFVFFTGSSLLLVILFLLARDSNRVRLIYKKYFSKLIGPDYYKEARKVKYENIFGNFDKHGEGITEDVKDGSLVIIRDAAKKDEEKKMVWPEADKVGADFSGTYRTYHDNGKLKKEAEYECGVLSGLYRTFYEDGTRHQDKNFRNGQLYGVFWAYDEYGIPYFDISYKNGVQHGEENIYYKTGVLQYKDTYSEGRRVNRKTYGPNGELTSDHDFRDYNDPERRVL